MTGKPVYGRRRFVSAAVITFADAKFSLTESVDVHQKHSFADTVWLSNNTCKYFLSNF